MIIKFVKRIIWAFLLIYSFDILLKGFGVIVPINYWTLGVVILLGYPGLIMLSLSFFFLL